MNKSYKQLFHNINHPNNSIYTYMISNDVLNSPSAFMYCFYYIAYYAI